MKAWSVCAIVLTSGCSVLGSALNSGPQLDPTKIYLQQEIISVRAAEIDRYACVQAPMICNVHGGTYDCYCAY